MERARVKQCQSPRDQGPDPATSSVAKHFQHHNLYTNYYYLFSSVSLVAHYISSGIICGKLSYVSWYITTFPVVFELVFYQKKIGTYFPLWTCHYHSPVLMRPHQVHLSHRVHELILILFLHSLLIIKIM